MPKVRLPISALICLMFILAATLAACAPAATTEANLPAGQIAVLQDGSEFAVIQVSAIGPDELTATFTKKGGAAEKHTYQASSLGSLLTAAGLSGLDSKTRIVITAKDGYASSFSAAEVQANNKIFLASRIDGQPIRGSDGKTAAMVIVPDDDFSNRWVSDILQIEIISG